MQLREVMVPYLNQKQHELLWPNDKTSPNDPSSHTTRISHPSPFPIYDLPIFASAKAKHFFPIV